MLEPLEYRITPSSITGLSPAYGPLSGGNAVAIYGGQLTGATSVTFGGVSTSQFDVMSDTEIMAMAPVHAAAVVDVQVTAPSGVSPISQADQYSYQAPAGPAVTAVSPNSGTTAGGTYVTISGSGFTGATGVSFGGVSSGMYYVVSDTAIDAYAPAQAAGAVDVTVTTANGTSAASSADQFTYTSPAPPAAPAVTGLSPNSGATAGGGGVTIYGSGFTGATAVTFGGVAAGNFMVMSDTAISAQAPAHAAGAVDVVVTGPGGSSTTTSADQYTYQASPAPTVTHVSPANGPMAGGVEVEIDGSGFVSGSTTVSFGGSVAGLVYFVNSTTLDVYSPIHAAGLVDVTVTTPNGTSATSAADQFTYNPPVWTVVNTADNGQGDLVTQTGDLRFCLNNAALAANGPGVVINFAIPGMGVQTITVASGLPAITQAITINGYTQGGGSSSGPLVQINGNGYLADGLDVEAGGVTIEGLAIYNFAGPSAGVLLNNPAGAAGDVISGCYIGPDAAGDSGVGNWTGVLVQGPNDVVGDAAGMAKTIVSGNRQDGIDVSGANAVGDLIFSTWVGLGVTGLAPLANGGNGVTLTGDDTVSDSVVSGNTGAGIVVNGASNIIYGDNIGVAKDGTTAAGNAQAGVLVNGSNNIVGQSGGGGRNVIAGNAADGVEIEGGSNNLLSNNYIGVDANGDKKGNSQYGVTIKGGATANTVGGTSAGSGNVISGNANGVLIDGGGTSQNVVLGNMIGTNINGTGTTDGSGNSTGNFVMGVNIQNGATGNTVGGVSAGALNVISGNCVGVAISDADTSNNVVAGNYIGTDIGGTTALANGIRVRVGDGASANTVGGTAAGSLNVISGNTADGVLIISGGTTNNVVAGNYIGTDKLGGTALANGASGVEINDSPSNTVGGNTAGARNVISGNTSDGVNINGIDAKGNVVAGDYIGADKLGGSILANGGDGVEIRDGASGNTVGGKDAGSLDVISGNALAGVLITGDGTTKNVVAGDYIGTDVNGVKKVANLYGVVLNETASGNTVGGADAGSLNVISGNLQSGVLISDQGTTQNTVAGDYIGTDKSGGTALANGTGANPFSGDPNGDGVTVQNSASGNTIGAAAVMKTVNGKQVDTTVTVISGNTNNGIAILTGCNSNQVINCYIGTDWTGTNKVANHNDGIVLKGNTNTIGGLVLADLNVISGNGPSAWDPNAGFGIWVSSGNNNVIEGDYIGTDKTGTIDLGNGNSGITLIGGATGNTIGGTATSAATIISANGTLSDGSSTQEAFGVDFNSGGNTLQNSIVGLKSDGTTALANKSGWVDGSVGNTVSNGNKHQ